MSKGIKGIVKAYYAIRLRIKRGIGNKQYRSPISFQDTQNEEKQINNTRSGEVEPHPNNPKEIDNSSRRAQKINELLAEKTKLLYEHGVFTFKKSVLTKHKEINEKLEALGVYQGKKPDQTGYSR